MFRRRRPSRSGSRNAIAAIAAATAAGASLEAAARGLNEFRAVKGRLQKKAGRAGATVIDDTYNANPDSVLAAIDVLARAGGTRVLVLGGSVMFDRHLAQRLKQAIATRTERPVELVGAGLRSHTSRSSLIKLQWFVQHHDADLVLHAGLADIKADVRKRPAHLPDDRLLDLFAGREGEPAAFREVDFGHNLEHRLEAQATALPRWRGRC